ncbi:MAG: recombinase family protein [Boseongicola sp.]|nr:recombinase family protein [Boseongicola sp.]
MNPYGRFEPDLGERIDRLTRSMKALQVIVEMLRERGVRCAATEQAADISTAVGEAFCDMLGVFAAFETNLHRERQAEGFIAAKRRDACREQPTTIEMDAIGCRTAEGHSPTKFARETEIPRGTIYKAKERLLGRWSRADDVGFVIVSSSSSNPSVRLTSAATQTLSTGKCALLYVLDNIRSALHILARAMQCLHWLIQQKRGGLMVWKIDFH